MLDKLSLQSPDLVADNFNKIAQLFPNCVTESATGKAIDFDLLKQELNYAVVEGNKERYRLEWPGKREAIVTANLPTTKTLRPVRDDSVDFDNTENIYIEGDNLEVLKLLQESYLGKIKMIYIDPPYNTGNDFIYKDKFFQDGLNYEKESGQIDEHDQRLFINPETAGRYHSDWLTMIYPRLKLARNLMADDGVIFISIDDNEIHNIRRIGDEIFGEVNFISSISRIMKTGGAKGRFFTPNVEYILVYARDKLKTKPFRGVLEKDQIERYYNKIQTEGDRKGELYGEERLYKASLDPRPNQRYWIECPDGTLVIPPGKSFPEPRIQGEKVLPTSEDGVWKWIYDRYLIEFKNNNIVFKETTTSALIDNNGNRSKWNIYNKLWLTEQHEKGVVPPNLIDKFENRQSSKELKELDITFDFAKPSTLVRYLLLICGVGRNDIVLDFFSGSATTAHAVMQLNSEDGGERKFIQIQLPEKTKEESEAYKAGFKNICEIGKERIKRSGTKILENVKLEIAKLRKKLIEINSELADEQSKFLKTDDIIDDLLDKKSSLISKIEETELTLANLDIGFRVYRLDESNMQDVYYKPQDYKQAALELFADNVKPDRTSEDLLAQVMLAWGLPLSLKIEQLNIAGKTAYKVAENSLYACFDRGIDEAFAKEIALQKPLRIVFRDTGFKDDTAKTNVRQLLKQLSPDTEMKVV